MAEAGQTGTGRVHFFTAETCGCDVAALLDAGVALEKRGLRPKIPGQNPTHRS